MLSPLLEQLKFNRLLRSPSEVSAFEAALAALSKTPNDDLLPALHLVLDDNSLHHEVMFGLVHYLESFDVKSQMRAFLDVLPQLARQAPEWTSILHFRILNDDHARACYRQELTAAGEPSRSIATDILAGIARDEGEPLRSAARQVLATK